MEEVRKAWVFTVETWHWEGSARESSSHTGKFLVSSPCASLQQGLHTGCSGNNNKSMENIYLAIIRSMYIPMYK